MSAEGTIFDDLSCNQSLIPGQYCSEMTAHTFCLAYGNNR